MADYAETQSAAAKKLGVSRATFIEMARDPGFPKKTAKGYNVDRCRAFAQKNARGPFRKGSGGESTSVDGVTLTEAKIRDTLEHAENERIKKERQLVEQAHELGEIVFMADVRQDYLQVVATVMANQDAVRDAQDRVLPESVPSAKAWPKIRASVLEIADKLKRDTAIAMKELA